jgi:hypothetical protein
LILALLREGADPQEIGAGEVELAAYQAEQQPAVAVEPALPKLGPEWKLKPAPRKKPALQPEAVGPLGEALLRAQREQDGRH